MIMLDLESTVMELIINSGEARSCSMEALRAARESNFDKAGQLMADAKVAANLAHAVQTKLIESDQGTGAIQVTLVMVHAQDHLMTSMLCNDLVTEMIEMYKRMKD